MQNKPGLKTTGMWIVILLLLLIILNILAFLVYAQTSAEDHFWIQVWNYLESATFKVITISLILPVILFFSERHFKIVDTIKADYDIRRRNQEEKLSEKRWECIEQASKLWADQWDLVSQIVYFKKGTVNGATIEELSIKLWDMTVIAEDLLNKCSHRFPGLPKEYYQAFKVFYDTELYSAETVVWCIRNCDNTDGIIRVQDALKRIAESLNYLVHHRFIDLLKHQMKLLELGEASQPSDKEKEEMESQINICVEHLKAWTNALMAHENENNIPFSFYNDTEMITLREKYKALKKWMMDNPGKDPARNYPRYEDFQKLFYKIPHQLTGPYYSKEYVLSLANWLSLHYERGKLVHFVSIKQPVE